MSDKTKMKSAYGKIGLVLILLFLATLSLRLGGAEMTNKEFFGGLFKPDDYGTQRIILLSLRLPRIFAAIVAGAGLSVSGVILQSLLLLTLSVLTQAQASLWCSYFSLRLRRYI